MTLSLMLIIFGILCLTGLVALVAVVVGLLMDNRRASRESTGLTESTSYPRPTTGPPPAESVSLEDQVPK